MSSRPLTALLACLLVGCGQPQSTSGPAAAELRSQTVTEASQPPVSQPLRLWSAGHETGDTSEWSQGQSGSIFNTGTGTVTWSDEVAHAGSGSLALTVSDAAGRTQAARIFRWAENPAEAYYSSWFYFPERVEPDRWWNIFQFKSKVGDRTDPTWVVNVGNDSAGAMRLYLFDSITRTSYHETVTPQPAVVPVREWTHIEVYLRQAQDESGRISLWQDGRLLYDLDGVRTTLADNVQWSLNNYSDDLEPADVTIHIDDAAIALERLGPQS